MELMQLEMFVAVAEERSFLRAAARVFRTPPAVSIGLRKLERRVGVQLFDRSRRRRDRLTPAGERLYEYARRILSLRDEAISAVKDGSRHRDGTLSVGLIGEEMLNKLPVFWKCFQAHCPGGEVKIQLGRPKSVLSELAAGLIDVAVVSGRPRADMLSRKVFVTQLQEQSRLWVVRQKIGCSPVVEVFAKTLLESLRPGPGAGAPRE
jgi:DNA-binding transcriptional LysR family regulator